MKIQIFSHTTLRVSYEVPRGDDDCYYYLHFQPQNETDINRYSVEARAEGQATNSSFS